MSRASTRGHMVSSRVLFASAWLLYLVLLVSVFILNRAPTGQAVWMALLFVAPSAVLGVGVVTVCRRLTTRGTSTAAALAVHVVAAVLFSLGSLTATNVIRSLPEIVRDGTWTIRWQAPRAVRFHVIVGVLAYCAVAGVTSAFLFARRAREEEQRAASAELLRHRAELQALRGQVNPHFLFNTLHSVIALARRDPADAERAVDQLRELLLYGIRVHADSIEFVPLAREWQFTRRYLDLEHLRLGHRLIVSADLAEEALQCLVPVFTLQPLVENAILHGIAPVPGARTLAVSASVESGRLRIQVSDDGAGADAKVLATTRGTGLRTLRQRLATLYDDAAMLAVDCRAGAGCCVTVRLPAVPPRWILEDDA